MFDSVCFACLLFVLFVLASCFNLLFVGFVCFVSFMFVMFCLFNHMFSCLFDSFAWLDAYHYFLFYYNCRYCKAWYKSMPHDWETVKTVSRETVCHMT